MGIEANGMADFPDKLKQVETTSIEFHLYRKDFEKWATFLGDATLTNDIAALRERNLKGDDLKFQLLSVVRRRLEKLRKLSSFGYSS